MDIYFWVDHNAKEQGFKLKKLIWHYGQVIDAEDSQKDFENYVETADYIAWICSSKKVFGVLMCGTWTGMSILANKFKGIFAARCLVPDDGSDAKTINNANLLCLSNKVDITTNKEIVKAFFETKYEGRKIERFELIEGIEDRNFCG